MGEQWWLWAYLMIIIILADACLFVFAICYCLCFEQMPRQAQLYMSGPDSDTALMVIAAHAAAPEPLPPAPLEFSKG